jgi:SAM-dependent methyltransferase
MNHAPDPHPELKARHKALWAWGDYPRVTEDLISAFGPELVEATGIGAGQRVLDVAAGTGNVAIEAARTGADVVASDLTPELLAVGEQKALTEGVKLTWQEADAEALPFGDGEFDVVVSSVGVMFAPHHQTAADELLRVCRPGGTIGLIAWTPEGFIGELFATMKPYAPAPPDGVRPPPLWGREEYVGELLGTGVTDVTARRAPLRVDAFGSPEEFRDYFKDFYGPTIAVYKAVANDPERVAALDRDIAELADRFWQPDGAMPWEYLLLTATRT